MLQLSTTNPDFWWLISQRMIPNHQSCCISVNVLMASLRNAYSLPINWLWVGRSGHESRNGWPWVWILHGGISWSNDITICNIWQIYWIPLTHQKSLVGLKLPIIYMVIQGLFVKSWVKCDKTFIQSAKPSYKLRIYSSSKRSYHIIFASGIFHMKFSWYR